MMPRLRRRRTLCVFGLTFTALLAACSKTDGPTEVQFDPLAITTASLTPAEAGAVYDETLSATGGDGTYVWTVAQGAVPAGLTLSSAGSVFGTPEAEGSYSFTVAVSSGDGQSADRTLALDVAAPAPLAPDELCSDHSPAALVSFVDTNLSARVRAAVGVGSSDPVTCAQAATVTSLTADGRGIQSLVGIQNLSGLTRATLHENAISDITPLAGLTSLLTLNLYSNPIDDLSPLAGLTDLEVLVLWDVPATDLSPLSSLTNLTFLEYWGSGSPVSDISALASLTSLNRLLLGGGAVANLDALSNMIALTDVDLGDNLLTDIGGIAALPELSLVMLMGNATLSDISALLNNPGIGTGDGVDLRGTAVSCVDVTALQAKGVNVSSDCP